MEDIATGWLRRWLRRTAPRRTPPRPGPASPAGPPALGTSGSPTSAALRAQAWILEYVNDAAIIIDPHRRILSWNRAAETIYGWTAAAVLGRDLHDVIPVLRFLDGSTLEDVLAAYHREGFWNGEVIQRHRDGHELVIDGTSRVIRDAHGQLAAILAVNRDITARRQVEQALRESEARFRQLFERSPDGIFLIDPLHPSGTWPIVDCNAAAARMHGYTREEIIGQSIHMFSPDPATPNPRQEHYAQLQRAGVLQAEDLHRRKDGSLLHIAYSTSLITLGGRPLVLGIDHDITQRKHAEARLQERERQLAEAQRLAHLGSWTWDLQTDQVQWSDELCRIFGIAPPPRGASLATFLQRVAPDARAGLQAAVQQALIDHQAYTAEHRVLRADGTTRILQTHVTVEVDTAGTPRRVVGTAQDVTEQKAVAARAEAEAARTRVLLRVAARLTQEQEVTAVLHALCEETAHVLQVPIAYVVLVDPTSEVLERVVGVGLPPDDARLRTPLARTRYQHYVGQQDYIVVPDLAAVPAAPSSALQQALNIRTVVSMNITRQETLVGALVVMTRDVVRHVTADELALLRGLADQAAQAIATTQLFEEVRRSHQRLRRLSQQLVTSQEAERRRLSRELHDEAGQALTALELSLQMIAGELPPTAAALRARLVDAISLTGTTLEQLRVLAQDLRPPALDTLGLNLTLEGFCHSFAQRTGLAIRYTGTELPGLPDALTIALYRLLQEALTNVVKHAHAHHVDVVLQGDEATIQLAIGDDGGGFDVPAVLGCPGAAPGIGLAGMQERLGLLGGVLEIASAPGQGTRVVARIGVAPGAAPGDRGARRPRAGQSASGGGEDG